MQKLSKAVIVSSILLASASAAQAQWQYNFLVGASAGYGDRSGDYHFTTVTPAPALAGTTIARNHSDSGFIWGLLGGFQAHCNSWLFGVETNVDWHDFDDARQHQFNRNLGGGVLEAANTVARYDRGTVVGLTARAGYQMTPYLMPYIRLGAETSNDEYSVVGAFGPANTPAFAMSEDKRTYRFLGGVGLEVPIPSIQGLSLRAEYNYHGKGKVVDLGGVANDNLTFVASNMKPKTHSGKASVVWNFL
ncbi:outer membrane beta-barrel protein [Candidatus Berkiella cookevillensis]|uniref:Outer membrane beta-barrel protein n=1 Tax=Candidatus Berkiella cookevillensis TaxID=437022 RepID=A0A0Q9YK44_9GAMM|nr:outer membrane beta-barrel protein [Candidatus Berkiella cookevillensis]MCS5709554.1 outer membrane beta-barrel protein [Candidatus Berkiella cookevillensis]